MIAEVIAVGDELTSGQRLDTNSQWLSQRLGEIGIPVLFHSTVGDDIAACVSVFRNAMSRANLIVATGGLGPTADDLTRDAIAQAAGVELELQQDLLDHIERMFTRRGRTMPERNRIQAMIPRGSQSIPNPHGTAPGVDICTVIADNTARTFALPGVPAEMKEMWDETVLDRIRGIPEIPNKVIRHHCLKCFGIGESACEELMPDLIRRGRTPSVGITVHRGTITLRITAAGDSDEDCRSQMASTISTIHECLGDLVFGEEHDELADITLGLLKDRQETVAVCEWGTAGLLNQWLGASANHGYVGGMVLRSLDQLDGEETRFEDPHSEPFAQRMADIAREQFDATYGIAVTAFPVSGNPEDRYTIAMSSGNKTITKSNPLAPHPDIRRDLAAKQVINLLRLHVSRLGDA